MFDVHVYCFVGLASIAHGLLYGRTKAAGMFGMLSFVYVVLCDINVSRPKKRHKASQNLLLKKTAKKRR